MFSTFGLVVTNFTMNFALSRIDFTHGSAPMSSISKSKLWDAHGVHVIFGYASSIIRPIDTQLDPLSVTTCTTFSLPTSSMAFLTCENMNSPVTTVPGAWAGIARKNIVPLQEDTRML
ncbi:hypothetical protein KP509_08G023100 [Ceratopteris richardii]|uniref:Uncharacterized protein n=1 Tax=Ceratopteris richardii TaxID=49495 RepID=A0A8T2U493_CERRI|nr:hypothetical protein KP509_08G023100 [Ceratopteris richardii]